MKKGDELLDRIFYPIILTAGFFVRLMPINMVLCLGRYAGRLIHLFYKKRKLIAYGNLKAAFARTKTPSQLKQINCRMFEHFACVLLELLRFPKIDERYIEEYTSCRGFEHLDRALHNGSGAIILTGHFGNWELSSLVGAVKGYPQDVLAREQKHSRLNALLNRYRRFYGRGVITKGVATRNLLKALKDNRIVAILTDQDAGKTGVLVNFFGRLTSTAPGAISFALKLNSYILPNFCTREDGPKYQMTIKPPLELDRTTDPDYNADEAIQRGLQRFTDILQDYIARFPHQWLWAHKRWKTSPSLRVLILADGKAGHLNQACAVSKQIRRIVFEKAAGDQRMELFKRVCNAKNALQDAERLLYSEQVLLVEFKSKAHRLLLHLCSLFASSGCQGCARCLGFCLTKRSYEQLIFTHADVIISCGWSLAGVNRFLSMENNAKKIVIMKPSFLPKRNFNLCIIPRHDIGKGKTLTPRIVITEGAPNLIDGNYIKTNAEALRTFGLQTEDLKPPSPVIGILLGGNTKNFVLNTQIAEELLKGIIDVAGDLDARLLITTSRRTPSFVEDILKAKLVGIERCKLLVIANEKNIPQAIGGILGLSDIVVVSGDSISMVSEAASSGKKVIVFAPESAMQRASSKHARFLKNLSRQGYITLATEDNITDAIKERLNDSAPAKRLNDSDLIYQALKRIV